MITSPGFFCAVCGTGKASKSAVDSCPGFNTCDTCGKRTELDTHLCGQCATDWNDRNRAAGLRRIRRRRKEAGLPPLELRS